MRRLWVGLGIALLGALVAACSPLPPPAGIQLTLPERPGAAALPVTIVDRAGIVRGAAPAEIPADLAIERFVEVIPAGDDEVLLAWIGGGCDDRAIVTIDPAGDRFAVAVDSQSSALGCTAVGVFRLVRLSLTRPVGADAFETT